MALADRSKSLFVDYIGLLSTAFRYGKAAHPFRLDAMVNPAGALALHLGGADWRRQLFRSLAAHQGRLFTLLARLQSSLSQQNPEKRTRHLATPLYTQGLGWKR
ncbi:MAG: hypothetical protein ABIT23_10210 [Nitrosospira sp.]